MTLKFDDRDSKYVLVCRQSFGKTCRGMQGKLSVGLMVCVTDKLRELAAVLSGRDPPVTVRCEAEG